MRIEAIEWKAKTGGNHRPFFCLRFWLLIIAGFSIEFPAFADNHDEPVALRNVQVTATRGEQSIQEIATAVTVVGSDEIRQDVPQVLPEVLRGQPGTWFQQTTPGQGTVVVRGLKGSQILHLVDGMRLNNAFFRSAPNQYLSLVDPFNTERIEVVRGPGATLYGADAMGGVVQILTPEHRYSTSDWSTGGNLYASWSSADLARNTHAEIYSGRKGASITGGISWQSFGNRKTGSGRIPNTDYESRAANLKLLYEFSEQAELMLSTQYFEQPKTARIDELIAGFGQTSPSSEQFWFRPNRREFFHMRLRYKPDMRWVSGIELHLARQKLADDRRSQNFSDPLVTNEFNDSELDGFSLQFDSYPGSNYRLTYGLEIYQDDIDSRRNVLDTVNGTARSVPGRFPDGSSMDSFAVYLHNEWKISTRWLLSGGLRYSSFDIELDDPSTGESLDLDPNKMTGNISASFLLTPGSHLVTNISRGFRPPNIFDLGTLGPRPGNRFNIGNTSLDSETIDSIDFGIKSVYPSWNAEAFVFYSEYDDKIASNPTGNLTPDGRMVVSSENLSTVKLYGFELGAAVEMADNLEVYGVINYTRGEEKFADRSDDPADRLPPLNGKIGFRYQVTDLLVVEPFTLFADDQDRLSDRDITDPRIDPRGTPGWATINVNLRWQQSEKLELSLRLENLFDKEYREHGSGIDATGRGFAIMMNSHL